MENISESSAFSSELLLIFFLETIFSTFNRFRKQSRRLLSFFSPPSRLPVEQAALKKQNREEERTEKLIVRREDVEVVMERMGLRGINGDGELLKEFMGPEELSAMFEDEEPSLEEVKEAFAVFDENGDGFVDAWELQRVLCKMGFAKGIVGFDSCEEMIKAHDVNGDGKIDFGEFVKLMESSFC
ncbi:hypothetical protein HPP92_003917 [Vanilla planifolia]|uniref:EF-hand domain-containing protein n=1 Tax=Vanilla planifolia TaxID=51239 RepID=A0A835RWK1_VANPL|nr:hypothetical protein HPP92_004332 [Vanilla planifolia]KAG0503845.1 hypothetical protein HPP92_003917 [Vanilla planifolia]